MGRPFIRTCEKRARILISYDARDESVMTMRCRDLCAPPATAIGLAYYRKCTGQMSKSVFRSGKSQPASVTSRSSAECNYAA